MLQRTLPAGFIAPCLPTKTDKLPSGSEWLHEIKHDGLHVMRTICRRGHAKEPSGRCKECERLTYERLVAARRAEGLTARGRPRYSLRTHCLHGHLRSDNEVRRKTNGTPYCRVCNLESMRRHRQRSRRLIRER